MASMQHQILKRVESYDSGTVVIPRDFLDLGSRDAVDQALGRLVRQGSLSRIGRGLYHRPRINERLGIAVPPDADDVAAALGRQTGDAVVPSPAVFANRLGLSMQVPAKPVYHTTGKSRKVQVGSHTYQLKHVAPSSLPTNGSPVSQLLYALQALGPQLDVALVERLRDRLSPEQQASLLSESRYCPAWVADTARRIAGHAA